MKLISYIAAFYMVGLSAAPCCAFDDCPDDKTEQSASHEKGDEDCGNCSPFFSCEGCATATVIYQPADFDFFPLALSPVYSIYIQSSLSRMTDDFWQPPKTG